MTDDPADAGPLPAGRFSSWLHDTRAAMRGERDADVPCNGCTSCCTSSQFVHIGPDETQTLAQIPAELLFPAPRMPRGHVLMGYDRRGHCPMLLDDRCSIYEHRPRTCRSYDCRVFAAAGVEPDADQSAIGRRARRWRFDLTASEDAVERAAVRAAAVFVDARRDALPEELRPVTATQLAVVAVRASAAFLRRDETGTAVLVEDPEEAAVTEELLGG